MCSLHAQEFKANSLSNYITDHSGFIEEIIVILKEVFSEMSVTNTYATFILNIVSKNRSILALVKYPML